MQETKTTNEPIPGKVCHGRTNLNWTLPQSGGPKNRHHQVDLSEIQELTTRPRDKS